MNLFCKLLDHTWIDEMHAPDPRWNTTKAGVVLVPTHSGDRPRYVRVCRRCGAKSELQFRLPAGALRDISAANGAAAPDAGPT
jgi:hypothetical protein